MRSVMVVLAVLLASGVARADPLGVEDSTDATIPLVERSTPRSLRIPIMVIENLVLTVPPAIYYWRTPDAQKEDWALHWDWASWKSKLTSTDPIVLDTNKFEANGIRHPMVGAMTYQAGRANGLGPVSATAMSLATSVFWEYVVEFKEQPSINDMMSNTTAGFLIGEPLFQIGLLADRHPTPARRALALLVSPFHRAQKEIGLSPLVDQIAEPNRLEVFAGAHVMTQTGEAGPGHEVRLGLELETFRDRDFARPGDDARLTGLGTWNRLATDLRMGGAEGAGISGGEFRSSTTYVGRLGRAVDDRGMGRQTFLGVGAGFDAVDRRLPSEWDKYAVFQLIEPRAGAWWRTPYGDLDVEAAVSGDLAMVQAHALAMEVLVADSSIVRTRGYYYATGVTAQGRVRLRHGRWDFEVEGVAHQFWSFDEHDHGGTTDPRDLADGRITSRARVGVRPFEATDVHVELYSEHVIRRGTGDALWRQTTELDSGLAVRAAF